MSQHKMTRAETYDLINDPTARVVSDEEAARLIAEEASRARAARELRLAKSGRTEARKLAMAPHIAAVRALEPGQSCILPAKEFALAYRIAKAQGFSITTKTQPDQSMVITRAPALGAAEGLL